MKKLFDFTHPISLVWLAYLTFQYHELLYKYQQIQDSHCEGANINKTKSSSGYGYGYGYESDTGADSDLMLDANLNDDTHSTLLEQAKDKTDFRTPSENEKSRDDVVLDHTTVAPHRHAVATDPKSAALPKFAEKKYSRSSSLKNSPPSSIISMDRNLNLVQMKDDRNAQAKEKYSAVREILPLRRSIEPNISSNRKLKMKLEGNETLDLSTNHHFKTSCVMLCKDKVDSCNEMAMTGCEDSIMDFCPDSCDICLTVEEETNHLGDIITTFPLQLNLMADNRSIPVSWTLKSKNDDDLVFDSGSELVPNTLHELSYSCTVSKDINILSEGEDKEEIQDDTQICYEFEMSRPLWDGLCCGWGVGYFELIANEEPAISDSLFSFSVSNSFCVNRNGELVDEKKEEHASNYISRECIDNECKCDSNPSLLAAISKNDDMYQVKMNVMSHMVSLSGSEKLLDIASPQYKAACWVLNDDTYFSKLYNNTETISKARVEERMIQRYILSLFFFATKPETWEFHHYFLSSRSECEWNEPNIIFGYLYGAICNENEDVKSINMNGNNMEGTIIEELYGLISLEQLDIGFNEYMTGNIPSSLGRLPLLKSLHLAGCSYGGTIPPQLFSNASELQVLSAGLNMFTGSIPDTIGNAQKLSSLSIGDNHFTGEIPSEMYSLKSLKVLSLNNNHLSSTISPLISELKNVEDLRFDVNDLSGEIPSSIKEMTSLLVLNLNDNDLSGPVPDELSSIPYLEELTLHDNNLKGEMPDQLCEQIFFGMSADCRNDVFAPKVSCSCCHFCPDNSPTWNGGCEDSTLAITIDHQVFGVTQGTSDMMQWSLVDHSTGETIFYDGPYDRTTFSNLRASYETCVVNGCFSLNMHKPPVLDTNYTIHWNGEVVHRGTFLGFRKIDENNPTIFEPTDWGLWLFAETKAVATFHYDVLNKSLIFDEEKCNNIEVSCGEEAISIEPNTTQRLIYNTAVEISGVTKIQDTSSEQSKALCWVLTDAELSADDFTSENYDSLKLRYSQRYILTLLHLTSLNGLFSKSEYPPETHECEWKGIFCSSSKIVTTVSISTEKNQIIGGTLLNELGSLAYLEKLYLSQTMLSGTIPQVYSNLWSLKELDLSDNALSGSIPNTLFDQLPGLMYLNLSKNRLSSSIPSNLGKFSEITSIILSQNQFIGTVSLDSFKWFSLKHLDISENQLSNIDLELLVQHTHLETLNLGRNFFAGKLQENTFVELSKLKYFNISQNEIDGKIPTKFTMISNMTHLDIHDNRFSGTVPMAITNLISMKVLNLQGNRLTGSIPSQLNELKQLEILAVSNNELKGSIPLDLAVLTNVDGLYLHNNKLSGEAPKSNKKMKAYITDCGYPSDSLEPVSCSSCNICCNSENLCAANSNETINSTAKTLIIIFSLYGLILVCYIMKRQITNIWFLSPFFSNIVSAWDGLFLISGKSVYHFMLTKNKFGWFIAFACSIFQILTLFLFVKAADINSESGDLEYTITCPANSLDCENVKSVSPYGIFIFSTVIGVWLLRDIISSLKLMLLSFQKKSVDFLFASSMIFLVTVLSLWTSAYYILAIATKNTDLIKDAVILLFVIEIDERIYQLAETINPDWVREIELDGSMRNMRNNVGYTDLLISSWIRKSSENFQRSIPSLRSFTSFSKKRGENERRAQTQKGSSNKPLE